MKNKNLYLLAGLIFSTTLILSCSGGSDASMGSTKEAPSESETPSEVASDKSLSLKQNSSKSLEIDIDPDAELSIVIAPQHGRVRVSKNILTYRATDPLFSGNDSFKYKIIKGSASSDAATVSVEVTPANSGTSTFVENYSTQAFALSGWKSYTSAAGHTASSTTEFRVGSYNGAITDARRFAVFGDSDSYAGDAVYSSLFASLPVDGAGGAMKDWPWKADLIHIPECGVDTTITVKLTPNGGLNPMFAVLLNYDIEKTVEDNYELTGYHVLLNSGGGSLTLSRFNEAHELATAYLDRWPNTAHGNEAFTNPVDNGPYRGWNYRNGIWPAGGNVGANSSIFVAIRYQYDTSSGDTTISYEARRPDGTDLTPGVWDEVVHLTGADSLATGGSFGLMPLNYHTTSMLLNTDFDIAEYKLQCVLP